MSETDNTQKRIVELEEYYKKCVDELNLNNFNVSASEKKLLNCLQQLMPLQNVYLTDLIKTLQNEIVQLKHPIVKKEPLSTNLLSVKSKLKVEQGVNNVVNLISEDELNDVLYK